MPDSLNYTITLKKRATAEQIQADLQARIDRLAQRDEKYRGCRVTPPHPIAVRGDDGPNWTVAGFPGLPSGCFTGIVKVLDQARMEYELVG
jgi:hypothetical protein